MFIITPVEVNGISMEESFYSGDRVLVWHIFTQPKNNDVVIIDANERYEFIKLLGIADQVVIKDVKEMEIQGYKKAKAIMEFVFADGLENTEAIYGKTEALNAMNSHKVRRTTSDIINDNFDKLKKRLAKRKIVE